VYVINAVRMSCRRRSYREATHEELKPNVTLVGEQPLVDQEMLAREEQCFLGPQLYVRRFRLLMAVAGRPSRGMWCGSPSAVWMLPSWTARRVGSCRELFAG
jgi:hypothetical protein